MAGDDSSKLRSLIQKAVMLSDEERKAFLDEECKNDISLRRRIEEVLASIDDPLTAINNTPQAWGLPAEGSRIGKYTIIEKLGGGGMGVVYRAEDSRLKRHVALKFLAPELTRDEDARDRFVQEAQAASALDHSNICTVYEVDETPQGLTYISMACYEGETLKRRLEAGPLPVQKAINFATQIGKGLARAHAKGIVHRDIKPGNIMIVKEDDRETIKILDFGLAKVSDVSLTRTGSTLGTAAYMSPEQAKGAVVDHRTDIWSLGVLLYEMLTGVRPFGGAFEQAIMYSLLHDEHKSILQFQPDLPEHLDLVIRRVLEKDVETRFQDIESFLKALNEDTVSSGKSSRSTPSNIEEARTAIKSYKSKRVGTYLGIAAVVLLVFIAGRYFRPNADQPVQSSLEIQKSQLTFTGNAYKPSISPDGQLMAYLEADSDSTVRLLIQELSGGLLSFG